jgi:uncharacterized RDD family membrane protein YckC
MTPATTPATADIDLPATLWRRFAAAVYDGLLLIGLWMATLLLTLPLRGLLGLAPGNPLIRLLLFCVGLAFFGGFWTRGGQTLGMRAWRLQLRRRNGDALRWPVAVIRYAAMMTFWTLALVPFAVKLLLHYPKVIATFPHALQAALMASTLIVLSLALRLLDAHRGLPHDWVAGTTVIYLPRQLPPVAQEVVSGP